MNSTYSLVFDVEPVAKGRPKFSCKGFAYTPKKTRAAESDLKILMRQQWTQLPLEKPLQVQITFSITKPKSAKKREYPSVKPDIDNLIKLVTDAGNDLIWHDDNQIVSISARKIYGPKGISLEVTEL